MGNQSAKGQNNNQGDQEGDQIIQQESASGEPIADNGYSFLGANKNYKTKKIQDRWEQQRSAWLDPKTHVSTAHVDPRDGIPGEELPIDHNKRYKEDERISVRKKIKQTMRSTTSPYEPFEAYYPLEEVVDTYMEIWYNSDSDDSSS